MATLNWTGVASTDSTDMANWVDVGTGSAPTSISATDTLLLKGAVAAADCLIGQSSLGLLTTDEEFARTYKLMFGVGTLQLMQLTLAHEQKIQFTQSSTTITFAGTHPTGAPYHNHPVIFYGDVDYVSSGYAKTTVSFILNNTNGAAAYLTNGELPNVTLNNKFTFNRSADVDIDSTPDELRAYSESNCCKLTIGSTATFDNTPISYSDTQKHIRVTGNGSSSGQHFACAAAICDFSNAKLTIDAKNSQQMPCTNDTTNFGTTTDFIALLEDVVVGNFSGNANKNIIPEGLTLECASLEIQSGSYLYGGGTNLQTGAKSHIHVIEKPTIRGTWNFEETANGIYSSIGGVSSASIHTLKSDTVHILGKLTVDGLIDPTGLELTPVGSNPGGVANNTLWLDSTDSNKLKLGSSEVSGGGGGGGTVDVVSNVATSRILGRVTGGSGDSEELSQAQVLTFLGNAEAGADVTDTSNVTAAGALMDSEVTNLAQVKAFNTADYATAAQGVKADSALQPGSAVAPGDPVSALANDLGFVAAGDPVSVLANDAGYLTATTTPTAMFAKFRENTSSPTSSSISAGGTGAIILGSEIWVTETGNATLLATMNQTGGAAQDGVMTFTAATAGTYQINIQIQYGSSSLAQTSGATYKLQLLPYHLAAASAGSFGVGGGNLLAYSRKIVTQYWQDQCQQISFMATFADGDLFWVQSKIVASSGSGNYKIKGSGASGSSTVFLDMIRIA